MSKSSWTGTITTEQVAEIVTAAGLDPRDFKCDIVAKRSTWCPELTWEVWEELAHFCRNAATQATADRAWELAGTANPYADDAPGLVYDAEADEWVDAA